MSAQVFNFTIEQGTTADSSVVPPIEVVTENESIFDLTGWSVRGDIKKTFAEDEEVVASFDFLIDIPSGTIQPSLSSTVTTAFEDASYRYDIELYNTADPPVVYRLRKGRIKVDPEITTSES